MLTYPLFCGMIISPYLQDLVVGAPYEGRGVVYLYQGGPSGLNPRPSQLVRYIWDVDILGDPLVMKATLKIQNSVNSCQALTSMSHSKASMDVMKINKFREISYEIFSREVQPIARK